MHQRDVFFVAVVVIAGDVAGVAVGHASGRVRKARPDARAGSVRERRSLDLIRRGGGAPEEVGRKTEVGHGTLRVGHEPRGMRHVREGMPRSCFMFLLSCLISHAPCLSRLTVNELCSSLPENVNGYICMPNQPEIRRS